MADALQADSLEASVTVAQLERSVAWYCDALGFVVDRKHEREGHWVAASLRAGAVRILLSQDDGTKGVGRTKGEGISLQITTSQSAEDIAARLVAHGTSLDLDPTRTPWGMTVLRVRDPDGFRLTISSTHVRDGREG
ncbi:MAG: VOC family protein [Gemmatimonadaceae bacterium]|nr:VOC family protein [Gemmatimonadaceae bacterium]